VSLNAVSLFLALLVVFLFGILLLVSPATYGYLLMEDTPTEWFSFLSLLGAGFLWLAGVRRTWRKGQFPGSLFCLAMAALCIFVAGEEISWGQRLLSFQTPGYFAERNIQGELTVHNLSLPWMRPRRLAFLIVMGYGVVLPGLARLVRWIRETACNIGIPIPSPGVIPAFALTGWLLTSPITATDDEVGELIFAVALLSVGFSAAGFSGKHGGKSILQFSALSAVVACGLSVLSFTVDEEREHLLFVGPLQAGQAYEGRGMKLAAAREYEKLASYWQTDWELWVKIIDLTYEGGETLRAFQLAEGFLRIHRREWRVYEILLEIGHNWGIHDHIEDLIQEILLEEPDNEFARQAHSVLLTLRERQVTPWESASAADSY
jgi:hypothetical protein